MLGLHVVFAVDRAGIVGEDGETHHGVFDTGFLRHAPGLLVLCPASRQELRAMLTWAVEEYDGPVAIRYPRGSGGDFSETNPTDDGVVCHKSGSDVAILTYGTLINNVLGAVDLLEKKGIEPAVLRLQQLKPLPVEAILKQMAGCKTLVVAEEANADAGIAAELAFELGKHNVSVKKIDLGHEYVPHGAVDVLYDQYGLSPQAIADFVQEAFNEN